jgi:RNase P/RNase MRP subunit POP5
MLLDTSLRHPDAASSYLAVLRGVWNGNKVTCHARRVSGVIRGVFRSIRPTIGIMLGDN